MLADWIHIDQMHADADVCLGSTYTGRRIYMQEGEARREQLLQMLRDSTAPIGKCPGPFTWCQPSGYCSGYCAAAYGE